MNMDSSRINNNIMAPNQALASTLRLSSSLPRHISHVRSHKLLHPNAINATNQQLSASIPLPKSHIHRTPSELQLVDDTRRAEFENVRMYARLVMRSQNFMSGFAHPLTWKRRLDHRTKHAGETPQLQEEVDDKEKDWELSYYTEKQEDGENASLHTPWPCHPVGTADRAPTVFETPAEGSVVSDLSSNGWGDPEDDDDCIFSLEL